MVFLGNTGSRYARTRHNVAWLLEEKVDGGGAWQQKFKGVWRRATIEGEQIVVLKPQTMMNLSGEAVQAAARFFKYRADEVAIAHDDVELGFGEAGIRMGGGLAGHNGLRSVAHCLGTREFWRVRIGVGRPRHGELHGHVLGRFSSDEEAELPGIVDAAARLVRAGYRDGFASVPEKTRLSDADG